MVNEITRITIDPDRSEAFEAAVAHCANIIKTVGGCHGLSLEREIEDPSRYYMQVSWDSVDAHRAVGATVAAQMWADHVIPFYREPSVVVHTDAIATYF